jgi:hypothetical protein
VKRDSLLKTIAGKRCAGVADELAVPGPFSMSAFCSRLEQVTGREIWLHAVRLPAAVGSGIRLGGESADHFYYEERTSPFHQAHIVVELAARMLLADPGPVIDAQITQGLEPRLLRHVLGERARIDNGDADAEVCAYLVLEESRLTVSPAGARRLLADLEPLHRALASEASDVTSGRRPDERTTAGLRLYQVVIEILDLMLVLGLQQESPAGGGTLADEASRLAGMSGEIRQIVLHRNEPPKMTVTDPGDDGPLAGA